MTENDKIRRKWRVTFPTYGLFKRKQVVVEADMWSIKDGFINFYNDDGEGNRTVRWFNDVPKEIQLIEENR